MTPVTIVACASAVGIEMLAVADHNAIDNVAAAMEIGEALGVTVVPALELQTAEDIHVLCLFETFDALENFYRSVGFPSVVNRPELFGNQLIINSDDEVCGTVSRLLSTGSSLPEYDVCSRVKSFGGIAIPAHIDRDVNGMVAVLGDIPDYYTAVELSANCSADIAAKYANKFNVIFNSDSHSTDTLGAVLHTLELDENTPKALIKYLNRGLK
jgi:Predicted metal-dependent phosphoesterases (PHP family)